MTRSESPVTASVNLYSQMMLLLTNLTTMQSSFQPKDMTRLYNNISRHNDIEDCLRLFPKKKSFQPALPKLLGSPSSSTALPKPLLVMLADPTIVFWKKATCLQPIPPCYSCSHLMLLNFCRCNFSLPHPPNKSFKVLQPLFCTLFLSNLAK